MESKKRLDQESSHSADQSGFTSWDKSEQILYTLSDKASKIEMRVFEDAKNRKSEFMQG